jgi:hypothetical protein
MHGSRPSLRTLRWLVVLVSGVLYACTSLLGSFELTTPQAPDASTGLDATPIEAASAIVDASSDDAPSAATIALVSSQNPSFAGAPITFTATVTGSGGTPTGDVAFTDGSSTLGSSTLQHGAATLTTTTLSVGTHTIMATYAGDGTYGAAAASVDQTVAASAAVPATVDLASTPSPSVSGQAVTLTATVASDAGTPTGVVAFKEGTDALGTSSLNASGRATITLAAGFTAGTHSLTAEYGGDPTFRPTSSASVTQTVGKAATTTTVSSSSNPSLVSQSVTFTATLAITPPGAGVPSGSLTFFDGPTSLGEGTWNGSEATFTTTDLALGSHSITASFAGSSELEASTSPPVVQSVATSGATMTLASSKNPSAFGDSVTFTATLVGSNGPPTGSVTFSDGPTSLGSAAISAGTATFTTGALAGGPHTIAATYGGDATYSGASSSVAQTVSGAATTTVLTSDNDPAPWGTDVNLTATVSSGVAGAATGSVSPDQLFIYWASNQVGTLGQADIWFTGRSSVSKPFSGAKHLDTISSPNLDYPVWVSSDSCTIYLVSDRPGSSGRDIWRATKP